MNQSLSLDQAYQLVTQLIQEKKYAEAESIYQQLITHLPQDLNLRISVAQFYLGLQQYAIAQTHFDLCLEHDPSLAAALNGSAYCDIYLNQAEAAVLKFKKLTEVQIDFQSFRNLGLAQLAANQAEDAVNAFEKSLEINPRHPLTFGHLGSAFLELGKLTQAEKAFDELLKHNGNDANARYSLSFIFLLQEQYQKGWEYYESRFQTEHYQKAVTKQSSTIPLWTDQDLNQKKLLVIYEHGFGDSIQFIRFLKNFEGSTVQVSCLIQKELIQLLSQSFTNIEWLDPTKPDDLHRYDYHIPLHSLALRFSAYQAQDLSQTIALTPTSQTVEKFKTLTRNPSTLKVGIAWMSESKDRRSQSKSITLESLTELFQLPDCSFHALHLDHEPLSKFPKIHSYKEHIHSFDDTAALVEQMDFIISIDCCVAHLAGSMQKDGIVLVKRNPYWCWLQEGDNTPWYPSLKIFRPENGKNFYNINLIKQHINACLAKKT